MASGPINLGKTKRDEVLAIASKDKKAIKPVVNAKTYIMIDGIPHSWKNGKWVPFKKIEK